MVEEMGLNLDTTTTDPESTASLSNTSSNLTDTNDLAQEKKMYLKKKKMKEDGQIDMN